MRDKPLVSIVVTCYNYMEYVGSSIQSVLDQTYQNIELIVIDDGSTDDSLSRIMDINHNDNFKVITRDNKGVIYTRNEGVSEASGDFIIQLDADDTLDKYYVEKCVNEAEEKDLDIVYTQAMVHGRVEFITDYIEFDLEKLKHDNYMHAASMIRTSVMFKDPYDEYLDKLGNEDWDLFLTLCLKGAKAGLLDEPLLNYRKHIDRKSRADEFEGTYKEVLVRHHILQKQNSAYPEQFWYFSSTINTLYDFIELYSKYENDQVNLKSMHDQISSLSDINKGLASEVNRYERTTLVGSIRRIKRHWQ